MATGCEAFVGPGEAVFNSFKSISYFSEQCAENSATSDNFGLKTSLTKG